MAATSRTKSRIVGSNFTTFVFNGQTDLAWLENVTDSGQNLFGPSGGIDTIMPLGNNYPKEIVTSRVLGAGTLTFSIRELWNEPAWQQLTLLAGTNNIAEIVTAVASSPTPIGAQMIIKPAGSSNWRGWTYNNLTITQVDQSENIQLGALTFPRTITALYTHRTPLVSSGPAVY